MEILTANSYLIAGSESSIPAVLNVIEASGISLASNPDVYVRSYVHFGIDDALELRHRAQMRGVRGGLRTFIIHASTLTTESQNALLKTLEEPPADARFFLITPAPETLLATVRSRAQTLHVEAVQSNSPIRVNDFISASIAERLRMIEPLLEKGDDDRRDFGAIILFLDALERALALRDHDARTAESLRAIYRARGYLGDKGALVKPLLESVALLV